jgi:hypothetical protein
VGAAQHNKGRQAGDGGAESRPLLTQHNNDQAFVSKVQRAEDNACRCNMRALIRPKHANGNTSMVTTRSCWRTDRTRELKLSARATMPALPSSRKPRALQLFRTACMQERTIRPHFASALT